MFWADKIAKEIVESGKHIPYHVDDMFTPSGFAHIGSLRGPLVHDLIFRALKHAGQQTKFTYIFNDFDPIDGLPPELEKSTPYLGVPLRAAPSPEPGYSSFAEYFTNDFKNVLLNLGMGATFLSSWDMYHEGKFNDVIKIALDNAERIQDIYQKVSGSKKKQAGWMPLQVVCEKCGKLGTTRVHGWDGKTVEYTCEPTMVKWAAGCGYTGRMSPYDGNGKLPWKVDWPAHWTVLGVTIEGAGKDHSSAGGSRDIAKELCRDVFHIDNPYNLPYEFFLIGGKKMSSSKGLGLKGRDLTSLLPAPVGRFLFTRTDYRQAIEFDPLETMAIPDLFDEYDRCWLAYISGGDENQSRAFELSQINELPPKEETFLPRFRDVANYLQLPNIDLQKKFAEVKGSPLTPSEIEILKERDKYARIWLGSYAPSEYRLQMTSELPVEAKILSAEQKVFLRDVITLLERDLTADEVQVELYNLTKSGKLEPKKAFSSIYLSILGREHGPRAAWFLLQYPKEKVIERLMLAIQNTDTISVSKKVEAQIQRPDLFIIDPVVRQKYPSISIGIAIIRGVNIAKQNELLEKEKLSLIDSLKTLTNETIGQFSEILSYRKLYKEMGIDWHSRRPSPEALLRRVMQGKGLYTVNTCVDAYNLVVMKHRVSVGAFDLNQVKFPTVLRYANSGDEILLLGDEKPTVYREKELAYYDQNGGYNIDFNYRDAKRTMVTEKTKDIWINVDGIFDITPDQVQQSLKESIDIIVKYCGGTVEYSGLTK
jgi:lysyl-tRNA synthetase class 1